MAKNNADGSAGVQKRAVLPFIGIFNPFPGDSTTCNIFSVCLSQGRRGSIPRPMCGTRQVVQVADPSVPL